MASETRPLLIADDNDLGQNMSPRVWQLVAIILVAVFIAFRVWDLGSYSLWWDEIFSLTAARQSWPEFFQTLAIDKVHPPLFYVLLKVWIAAFGDSLIVLKLFPFITSLFFCAAYWLFVRDVRLNRVAAAAAFGMIALNTYLAYFAQELRMYSLVLLFVVGSMWTLVRYLNRHERNERDLILLFVIQLLLVYTHYFGWMIVGIELLSLVVIDRDHLKKAMLGFSGLILLYLPWVFLVYRAISDRSAPAADIAWLDRPHLSSIVYFFSELAGPAAFRGSSIVRIVLFLVPVALAILLLALRRRQFQRPSANLLLFLLALTLFPAIIVFLVSLYGPQPLWHPRYMVIAAIPAILLFSFCASRLRPRFVGALWCTALFAWAAVANIGFIGDEVKFTRVQWDQVINDIVASRSDRSPPVKIYDFEMRTTVPLQFYLQEAHQNGVVVESVANIDSIHEDNFWLVYSERNRQEDNFFVPEFLTDRGYRLESEKIYGHAGERIYVFSFRKIR